MMRRVLLLTAGLACVALGAGSAGATPASPFLGTWWAVDTSDGSLEQLTFGAGGAMFFRDDSAHVCNGVAALAQDTGVVTGSTWTGSGTASLRCPAVGTTLSGLFFQFTVSPDGTLSGSAGPELWTRARP
jgi:hypothetical protein